MERNLRGKTVAGRFAALLLVVAFAGGCDLVEQMQDGRKYDARIRVEAILEALEAGNHLTKQKFSCLYGKGSTSQCSPEELRKFYDDFRRWLQGKKLDKGIDSWEIVDYWEDPDIKSRAYHFHVRIDGKDQHMTVLDRGHMSWAKKKARPAE